MASGRIILLNGSSSAGKTTLALMIQQLREQPIQHIALDQFRDGMPGRFRGFNSKSNTPGAMGLNIVPVEQEGMRVTDVRFGDHGRRMLRGMRRAVAAFVREGNDALVDDLMLEPDFLTDYLEAFEGLEVLFVGVHCTAEVVAQREEKRPGRFPGTAIAHFNRVHERCEYDLEVDTTATTPRRCAERVLEAERHPFGAFERMRHRFKEEHAT